MYVFLPENVRLLVLMSLPVVSHGVQIEQSFLMVGSCTWTESLVHLWLSAANDDCLRERLLVCLSSSHSDVTLACLNWIEASCDVAKHSKDTQLLLQVSDSTSGTRES